MANIETIDDLLKVLRRCYFMAILLNIVATIPFFIPFFFGAVYDSEPIGLNELFLEKIPAMIEENGKNVYLILIPFIVPVYFFVGKFSVSKYKQTYEQLLSRCQRDLLIKYLTWGSFSALSLFYLDASNGNMVFLLCFALFFTPFLLKFPTKDKVVRAVEAAVEKNNQLPDDPNAKASASPKTETYKEETAAECVVVLVSTGVNKMQTLKAVKETANISISAAKCICDNTPSVIAKTTFARADVFKKAIEEVGCAVEIKKIEDASSANQ